MTADESLPPACPVHHSPAEFNAEELWTCPLWPGCAWTTLPPALPPADKPSMNPFDELGDLEPAPEHARAFYAALEGYEDEPSSPPSCGCDMPHHDGQVQFHWYGGRWTATIHDPADVQRPPETMYRVTVVREVESEQSVTHTWTLWKAPWGGPGSGWPDETAWVKCRRDDPADDVVFAHLDPQRPILYPRTFVL